MEGFQRKTRRNTKLEFRITKKYKSRESILTFHAT